MVLAVPCFCHLPASLRVFFRYAHPAPTRRTRMRTPVLICLAVTLGLPMAAASAQPVATTVTPFEQELLETEGILGAHPGFRWRREALLALEKGEQRYVQTWLERAARYADKPAQALIAERYWQGSGVARDPALAYAWMDLAAERGYTVFVAHREKNWAALDAAERRRALEVGKGVYAEFGDDVAQPRLAKHLERKRRTQTGSHVGTRSMAEVYLPPSQNPSGEMGIGKGKTRQFYVGKRLPNFYQDKLWKADAYFAWQDAQYVGLPEGIVTVGDMEAGETKPNGGDALQ